MEIEFVESAHLYLKNGILVPSVSEILKFIFPNKYDGIPKSILDAKAEFGTKIHEAIELYESNIPFELTPMEMLTFNQYLKLREIYNIKPKHQELLVSYKYAFCGRLDMIAEVDGKLALVDIKTTAKLDYESLAWQLGMYQLGYGETFEKCYCLWLPKRDLGQLVEIEPKTKEEIEEVLNQYESYRTI